ncbi:MAG: ABC transporter substrate-binding protein, partial [Janthinobacterium lividum]
MLMLLVTAQARAEDIVLGAGFGLSGQFASYGEDAKAGVDLALMRINAAGGVLGRPLRVVYEDTGADRGRSVAIYRRFASQPQVVALLSLSSVEFSALDAVAPDVRLPIISVGSSAPVARFSPWSFRVSLVINKAIGPVLDQIKTRFGVKTVGIIVDADDSSSVAQAQAVKAAVPAEGLRLAGIENFNTGDQDFATQLTNFVADPPDLIFVGGTTNEASLIISQARAMGLKSLLFGGVGFNDPRISRLAGDTKGVLTFFSFDLTDERPIVRDFVTRYHAQHDGAPPTSLVALGYDATALLADAITRAGSTDRDAVRIALGHTKGLAGVNG